MRMYTHYANYAKGKEMKHRYLDRQIGRYSDRYLDREQTEMSYPRILRASEISFIISPAE